MRSIWHSYRRLSLFWAIALPGAAVFLLLGIGVAFVVQERTTSVLDAEMHQRMTIRSMNTAAELNYLLASPDPAASAQIDHVLNEPVESPGRLYSLVESPSGAITHSSSGLSPELVQAVNAAQGSAHDSVHTDAAVADSMHMDDGVTDDGHTASGTTHDGGHAVAPMEMGAPGPAPAMSSFTAPDDSEVMHIAIGLDDGSIYHIGHTTDQMRQITESVISPMLVAIGFAIILSVLSVAVLARQVATPLRSLLTSVRRIEDGDYDAVTSTTSFREISELSTAITSMSRGLAERQQLREDNERLEEVDRLKTEFVALASHELRTPLTGILGYSQLLEDGNGLADTERGWAEHFHREASHLAEVVELLLNVTVMESGELEIESDSIDLEHVIEAVMGSLANSVDRDRIELECSPGAFVIGDHNRLVEVLGNLVENAIKYSPDGGRIWVSCTNRGGSHEVSVRDEGLGIPAAELPNLFTRFHRIPRPGYEGIRSTGLGLYLVKSYLEAMGGTIEVDSTPGEGSRFSFTLPRAAALHEAA